MRTLETIALSLYTLIWVGLFFLVVDGVRQDAMRVLARIGELRPGKTYWLRAFIIVSIVALYPVCVVRHVSAADWAGSELVGFGLADARADLAARGYNVADLDVSDVRVLEMRDRMACAGTSALGCFAVVQVPVGGGTRTYGVMAYRRVAPSEGYSFSSLRKVLEHEWKHALLWRLGDPTWDVHDERFR